MLLDYFSNYLIEMSELIILKFNNGIQTKQKRIEINP